MARYIDLDEAIKHLQGYCKAKYPLSFINGISASANEISMLPVADVVPRTEVEELIRENKSLAKTVNEASELIRKLRSKVEKSKTKAAPTVSKMEQVRSEIIREIFEEADKIFMATCLSLETYNAWCELKKKYTERSDTK